MEQIIFQNQTLKINKKGGGIAEYYIKYGEKRVDLIYGYKKQSDFDGCMGDILSPFPGRVDNGKYQFEGKKYKLVGFKLYEKETPLHVFVREEEWKIIKKNKSSIKLEYAFDQKKYSKQGYPFSLIYSVEYLLEKKGLIVKIKVKNSGNRTAPFSIGFHPYLRVVPKVDQTVWQVPAKKLVEYGPDLKPSGKLLDVGKTKFDFRVGRKINNLVIDNCFTDLIWDKKGIFISKLADLKGKSEISVWQDKNFPYFQAYSSDTIKTKNRRKSLALEPQSSSPFAINIPSLGLIKLKPSQVFEGSWGISYNQK